MMAKRYAAEFIGTFGIVFAPVVLSATGGFPGGDHSLLAAALVSGLVVLAMIYTLGPISAAHFNPAVTLGFAVTKRFPWRFVLPYWIAQFLGGIVAAGIVAALFGPGHGTHIPADPSLLVRNIGMELLVTAILMFVVMAVATDRRVSATIPGLAIGLVVVVNVLVAGPITGGSMNPARSLGPALFGGPAALSCVWLYFAGPFLGATLAALAFESIRIDRESSKGAPNEILEALDDMQAER